MAHTASGLGALARWARRHRGPRGLRVAAAAIRRFPPPRTAGQPCDNRVRLHGPGFTAQDPFVVNSLGAGSQQQVRFAGPCRTAASRCLAVAHAGRHADLVAPAVAALRRQRSRGGRAIGPAVRRGCGARRTSPCWSSPPAGSSSPTRSERVIDPANPFVEVNSVLARTFQDGTALPGEITIGTQTVNVRSFRESSTFPCWRASTMARSSVAGTSLAG